MNSQRRIDGKDFSLTLTKLSYLFRFYFFNRGTTGEGDDVYRLYLKR